MNAKAGSRLNDGQLFSDLEHLSAEEMRSLHLGKLRKQMDYVCSRSDFYKDKFRSTGFRPEHLKSLEDLAALPFTEKDELRASLDAHPPLGRHLCAAPEEVVQLQASSGTTGKPSYIAYSAKDLRMVCDMTARCFFAAGLRKGDKVLHSFAMSRGFVGGLPMAQSLHHLGATVLPIGAEAGVERLLRVIEDQSPDGIIGAPSFLGYLATQAESVLGRPATELGVRHLVVGSEPGGGLPETRARIERLWGATVREMYGLSDLGNSFWCESLDAEGMHFMGQGYLHAELIDPISGELLPYEAGVRGELVYTALEREAMPLVRFRSRDQVEVLATEAVNRRVSPRVRVLGRTDDMLICRGVNVYPGAVSDIVAGLKPLTTGQFKIVVDFPGHSTDKPIRLRVEASDDTAEPAQIVDLVSQKVKDSLGFKVNVEIVPAGTYENPGSRKPVYIERV
jgi:phenylacetate-CoA ligase